MMLVVIDLRNNLLSEHKAALVDVIQMVEEFEKSLLKDGLPLDECKEPALSLSRADARTF